MIKETQCKFKIIFSLHLSFFVIFLFVCCCCFSFLFFRFLLISGLSALCHWHTLVMKEGIYLLVTNYMSPFQRCVMFTCATILLTYRSTMKHSPMATKVIKCLWGCPIFSLIHGCRGRILKRLALFVLKPESRTWRRYFQKCIEKSFFVSHFFFRAFKLDLQYNWSHDLYHLWM